MRRKIDLLILAVLVIGAGVFWYYHPSEVRVAVGQIRARILPCRSPITYSLGPVDSRFNMSEREVIASLKDAEAVWESTGKDLFEYSERGGDVTVNFVYDRRQESTNVLKSTEAQIDLHKGAYDALREKYEALAALVKQERALYERNVSEYESREKSYNDTVTSWNRRGGAPQKVFDQLERERAVLAGALEKLGALEVQLNADIRELNALADELNNLIEALNLNVAHYNQVGESLGEFEEGLYQSSAGVQTIDIYEFSSRTLLVRVLAHELGHAIGIGHVADPKAIMYKINEGDDLSLAADDIAALEAVCNAGYF